MGATIFPVIKFDDVTVILAFFALHICSCFLREVFLTTVSFLFFILNFILCLFLLCTYFFIIVLFIFYSYSYIFFNSKKIIIKYNDIVRNPISQPVNYPERDV
jgi:hypothetical protein